jgi:predicted transglutaminase-like cysteine proteinase
MMKRTVLLSVFLTIIVICGMMPSACNRGLSYQPSTINQMKLLVTPQDQTVIQALQEALSAADKSRTDNPPSTVIDINKIRLWVYSNIKQASDYDLHGVNDYWQTPTETLALKAGDCEDFSILVVSMLRAYGIPKDQVYVAVGTDGDKDWHAFVLERYSYGAWVEFDPQNMNDAVLLNGNMPLPWDISYCFNDQSGFNGKPVHPKGYNVPCTHIHIQHRLSKF